MTRVEHARRLKGWNQTVLAYHAGITQGEVSRIERRLLVPGPSYVERLSEALGVPAAALLDDVTDYEEKLLEVIRAAS